VTKKVKVTDKEVGDLVADLEKQFFFKNNHRQNFTEEQRRALRSRLEMEAHDQSLPKHSLEDGIHFLSVNMLMGWDQEFALKWQQDLFQDCGYTPKGEKDGAS